MQWINSVCEELFWKNLGEDKRPKFNRTRRGKTEKRAKDIADDKKDSASTSMSRTSSSESSLSELAPLPIVPDAPSPEANVERLESLPSRPDFAVDKELHKPLEMPGLPYPPFESDLLDILSDSEPACPAEEVFVPGSLMTHVHWPNPDLEMPPPVDFSFLLPNPKPSASQSAMPEKPSESLSSLSGDLAELSEFMRGCDPWADTFVECEASLPPPCEELAFADTLVEEEADVGTLQVSESQAGNCTFWILLEVNKYPTIQRCIPMFPLHFA